MSIKSKWLLYSTLGLILVGAGLAVFGEAVSSKMNADSWHDWFWTGTLSLIIINSGLSIFARGVIFRVQLENAAPTSSRAAELK